MHPHTYICFEGVYHAQKTPHSNGYCVIVARSARMIADLKAFYGDCVNEFRVEIV